MAEYKVTLSQLNEASSQLKQQAEAYLTAADELKKASDNLTDQNWQGEASDAWKESMTELYTWMTEMTAAVEGFGTVLTEASELYQQADAASAANFQ